MITLYVKARSKKEVNEKLANGTTVYGECFSFFGGSGMYQLDENLADGTVIKIFEKYSCGSPYAISYGTWNLKKMKVI